MTRLPIFPLGTVLFPGARLPLQLFEPRYLQLVQDLAEMPPDERLFGVVSLRKGHEVGPEQRLELAATGTAARIRRVARLAGGPAGIVLAVETEGTHRFRLDGLASSDRPYHVGEITWLPDGQADPEVLVRRAGEVRGAYRSFVAAVGGAPRDLAAGDGRLAYEIADSVELPLADRQAVLDEPDPVARIGLVERLLRRETTLAGDMRMRPVERHRFAPPSSN